MLLKLSNGKGHQANFAITKFSERELTVLVFSKDVEILEDTKALNMAIAIADYEMNTRRLNIKRKNRGVGGIYFHEDLKCFAREIHFIPQDNSATNSNTFPSGYDKNLVDWAKAYLVAELIEIPHV